MKKRRLLVFSLVLLILVITPFVAPSLLDDYGGIVADYNTLITGKISHDLPFNGGDPGLRSRIVPEPPILFSVTPDKVYAGKTTVITFSGDHFTEPVTLLFEDTSLLPPETVTFIDTDTLRFTVPATTPQGVYSFRVITIEGQSNPVFLTIEESIDIQQPKIPVEPEPPIVVPRPKPKPAPEPKPPVQPIACQLSKASWNVNSATLNDVVTLSVTGTNCAGLPITFTVRELDFIVDDVVTTLQASFQATTATASLSLSNLAQFFNALEGNELELQFTAIVSSPPVEPKDIVAPGDELIADEEVIDAEPRVAADIFGAAVLNDILEDKPFVGDVPTSLSATSGVLTVVKGGDPPEAKGPLAANQAFIKNTGAQATNGELAIVPLGFKRGEYTTTTLNRVRLKGLVTQAYPTSFYENNDVRTAVLYVQPSLQANEEQIYEIIDSTTGQPGFTLHPAVDAFFKQGELTVTTRDPVGEEYPVTVPLSTLKPYVSGDVIRKYRYIKKHDPKTTTAKLPYLFSSVFEIEVVNNNPNINIKHAVINSQNLDEDTYDPKNPPVVYAIGQLGNVKYKDIDLVIDTKTTPSNVYVSFLSNKQGLDPSFIAPKTAQGMNKIVIMPANGERQLWATRNNPYKQFINAPTNYLGASQGFLTEIILSVGTTTAQTHNPYYESLLHAGTGLIRWNGVDSGIFSQIPDPEQMGDQNNRVFWDLQKKTEDNYFGALGQMSRHGYRFGIAGVGKLDPGSSGGHGSNDKEPAAFMHYLFSCYNRCNPRGLQSLRLYQYSALYVTDAVVNFRPHEHPYARLFGYRTPKFPVCEVGQKDNLGYCKQSAFYQFDYNTINYNGSAWHRWNHLDDAHASLSQPLYWHMMTGDEAARLFGHMAYAPSIAHFNYGARFGSAFQTRAIGRGLHALADFYLTEKDPAYKQYLLDTMVGTVEKITDPRLDKTPHGGKGKHPLTLENFAVGTMGSFYNGGGIPGDLELRSFTWQHAKVIEGLSYVYRNIPVPATQKALIKKLVEIMTDSQFTYAFKDPNEIRNGFDQNPQKVAIYEGNGYFTGTMVIGPPQQGWGPRPTCCDPDNPPNPKAGCRKSIDGPICWDKAKYTAFNGAFTDYNFPGLCNALQYVIDSSHPKKAIWDDNLRNAFLNHVLVVSNNDARQFTYARSWSMHANYVGDYICPVMYSLGIPNTLGAKQYDDADGDGFSEGMGDCDDTNAKIYPAAGESWDIGFGSGCFDGIDANCNGILDCDDPQCYANTWKSTRDQCIGIKYCGNNVIENPNRAGRQEQCEAFGDNLCTDNQCVPSFTYAAGKNCFCKALPTCGDRRRNQPSEQCDPPDIAWCGSSGCDAKTCQCLGPVLLTLNPFMIDYARTIPITLAITGDNFVNGAQVKINNVLQPSITVNFVDKKNLQATIPVATIKAIGPGKHSFLIRNPDTKESRALELRINRDPRLTNPSPPDKAIVSNRNDLVLQVDVEDEESMQLEVYLQKVGETFLKLVKNVTLPKGKHTDTYKETANRIDVQDPNLHAYYKFEEGPSFIKDHSTVTANNDINRFLYGTPQPSLFGNAFYFDGKDSASLGNNRLQFYRNRRLTFEAWVKPAKTQLALINNRAFIAGKSGNNLGYRLEMEDRSGNYYFAASVGYLFSAPYNFRTFTLRDPNPLTPDTWHHIALVGDSNPGNEYLRFYVDGKKVDEIVWKYEMTWSNYYEFSIGGISSWRYSFNYGNFTGAIDDVLVYDKALSEPEIRVHALPYSTWPEGVYKWKTDLTDGLKRITLGTLTFTMSASGRPPPSLTALTPSTVLNDQDRIVVATGANINLKAKIQLNGKDHPASFVNVLSPTEINITVPKGTPKGVYSVTVVNPDNQTSNPLTLTVQEKTKPKPPPALLALQPSTITNDKDNVVDFVGRNFTIPAGVKVNNISYPQSLVTPVNATLLRITILKGTSPGTYAVKVVNLDLQESNTLALTVKGGVVKRPPPRITAIQPLTVFNDKTTVLGLLGTEFDVPAGVKVNKIFYPQNLITPVSATLINMTILQNAPLGIYGIQVVNLDLRESNTFNLTIQQGRESVPDEQISLNNSLVSFVFNRTATDKVFLERIKDLQTGKDFFTSHRYDIARFTLRDSAGKKLQYKLGDLPSSFSHILTLLPTAKILTLLWTNVAIDATNSMDVTATIRLENTEPTADFTVNVVTSTPDYSLYTFTFPDVRMAKLSDTQTEALVLPWRMGTIVTNPRQAFPSLDPKTNQYISYEYTDITASQTQTYQFQAYYNTETNDLLYFAVKDPEGYYKHFKGNISTDAISYGIAHFPENHLTPDIDYTTPYAVSLGTFKGDWFDATTYYRSWSNKNFITRGKLVSARGISNKFHDIDFHVTLGTDNIPPDARGNATKFLPEVRGFKNFFNRCPDPLLPSYSCNPKNTFDTAVVEYYGWHNLPFSAASWPRDYKPIHPAIMQSVKDLQQDGHIVIPYTYNLIFNMQSPFYNAVVAQNSLVNKTNDLVIGYAEDIRFVFPDPATSWWQDYTRDIMLDLKDFGDDNPSYAGVGFDGAYWDVWSGAPPSLDYATTHGHPQGGGNYWLQGEKQRIAKARAALQTDKPYVVFESEHPTEFFANDLEFVQWDGPETYSAFVSTPNLFNNIYNIPMYPSLYHDYIATSTIIATAPDVYRFGKQSGISLEYFKYVWAYYYSFGIFASVSNGFLSRGTPIGNNTFGRQLTFPLPAEDVPFYTFIKKLVRSYAYAKQYLVYGQLLRPLDFTVKMLSPQPSFGASYPPVTYYKQKPGKDVPAVVPSVWQAPDGSVAIVLINWWNETEQFRFTFDFAKYGLTPRKTYYLTKLGETENTTLRVVANTFTHSLQVPASSIQVLAFSPTILEGDDDKDGVPNSRDRCPNTQPAHRTRVNMHNGCPIPYFAKFSPALTTNFSEVDDLHQVPDLSLGIIGKGRLQYSGKTFRVLFHRTYANISRNNYEPLDLDKYIMMEDNNLTVVAADLPQFNTSATLTLYNVNLSNPVIHKDGELCTACLVKSYDSKAGTLVFAVPSFSSHSGEEGSCGDTICGITESCSSCAQDCGSCGGGGGGRRGGGGGGGSAGDRLTQTIDLDVNDHYTIALSRIGKLFIIFNKKEYSLRLPQVDRTSATLSFSPISYLVYSLHGTEHTIDFDEDSEGDVLVTLDAISTRNVATLSFDRIEKLKKISPGKEPRTPDGIKDIVEPKLSEPLPADYGIWLRILLITFVVGLAIFFKFYIRHKK